MCSIPRCCHRLQTTSSVGTGGVPPLSPSAHQQQQQEDAAGSLEHFFGGRRTGGGGGGTPFPGGPGGTGGQRRRRRCASQQRGPRVHPCHATPLMHVLLEGVTATGIGLDSALFGAAAVSLCMSLNYFMYEPCILFSVLWSWHGSQGDYFLESNY